MAAYQAHETAVIDPGCTIGDDTFIWHFSHIMAGCIIGEECNIGQNVVISPGGFGSAGSWKRPWRSLRLTSA